MKIDRRSFLSTASAALALGTALEVSPIAAQRALPKSEYDYVDWSWERWRAITRAVRPRLSGDQVGKAELVDLLQVGNAEIASAAQWQAKAQEIRTRLDVFLGTAPGSKPALEAKVIDETRRDGYVLRKLSFQSEPGEFVPAYLLVPPDIRGRAPAVLCPHQTTQAGKKEPAGLAGNPHLHTAMHLARRGYVTLTYDALCFGERHDLRHDFVDGERAAFQVGDHRLEVGGQGVARA